MPADPTRVAAVEELPPDARGARRVVRLHAVGRDDAGLPAPQASCGYRYQPAELRPDRAWTSVTASGRCTFCDRDPGGRGEPTLIDVRDGRDHRDVRGVRDLRDLRDVDGSRQRSER